ARVNVDLGEHRLRPVRLIGREDNGKALLLPVLECAAKADHRGSSLLGVCRKSSAFRYPCSTSAYPQTGRTIPKKAAGSGTGVKSRVVARPPGAYAGMRNLPSSAMPSKPPPQLYPEGKYSSRLI